MNFLLPPREKILAQLDELRAEVDLPGDRIEAEFVCLVHFIASCADVLELNDQADLALQASGQGSEEHTRAMEELGAGILRHICSYFASKGIREPMYAKFYLVFAVSDWLRGRPNPIVDPDLMSALRPKLVFLKSEPISLNAG